MESFAERDPGQVIEALAHKVSNWGRWGPDDQRGVANVVTPQKVLDAAARVRKGKVFSLAIPFDQTGPQIGANIAGRFNPVHTMLATGTDAYVKAHDVFGFGYADDVITMPLQCGTQWDGLSHVFHRSKMYNGYGSELVSSAGAQRNGIEHLSDRLVTRGVLLDMPRVLGNEASAPGRAYGPEDLDAAVTKQGVEVGPGDILLIRTGFMAPFVARRSWQGFADGDCPGLSYRSLEWLRERDIVAVATDTYRAEVKPTDLKGARSPVHLIALPYMGMLLGELFHLDALAADCAEDAVYDGMLVAAPLPFTGAVGSPINPCLIK